MNPHRPSPAAPLSRRDFTRSLAVAAAGAALTHTLPAAEPAAAPARKVKLGMDNFSIRAAGLKGRALVDYAASLRLDHLYITDLPSLGTLKESEAADLRQYAADKGLGLFLGSWSICPTSKAFRKDWGTADELLALGLKLAKAAGSPTFRVVLGTREDRRTPGGIEARIEDTIRVLKARRSLALDLGVKVAIENHAGDMTATELITLIEAAGKDWVGVNYDSGNALWTLEDPVDCMEKLAPYILTTHMRDSTAWETEKGCKVQWVGMGEGTVTDIKAFFARFLELCPNVAVNLENIGGFAVDFPYLENSFWDAWPRKNSAEFARFLRAVKRGKPIEQYDANKADRQKEDLEKSLRFCRETLGFGTRA